VKSVKQTSGDLGSDCCKNGGKKAVVAVVAIIRRENHEKVIRRDW